VYGRHRRWSLDGTWARVLDALRAGCDEAEGKEWAVSADSTVVRAHQHAAGARTAVAAGEPRGGGSE
jgi:transposase